MANPRNSPEIDPDGMRRRLDAVLEKDLLGEPLTEHERMLVQMVRNASRAARPVDPGVEVRVDPPQDDNLKDSGGR